MLSSGNIRSNDTPKICQTKLSIVVPCFNEEENLAALHRCVSSIARQTVGDNYELILVDDGSRDRTWPLIVALASQDPCVVGVSLSRNHGHQLALSAGFSLCKGECIFVLDADLQDSPELLPDMMRLLNEGADVVYGQRAKRAGETLINDPAASCGVLTDDTTQQAAGYVSRKESNTKQEAGNCWSALAFYRLLNWLVDTKIPVDSGDFRLISRRVLNLINEMPEQYRFIRGMVGWLGYKQVPLIYDRDERYAGQTKYPLRKMVRLALDAMTGFSIRPLRLATLLGFFFGIIRIIGLFYALGSWISGKAVLGWTSVIITVLLLGSAQLFVLGIIGEYLGRLYIESKRRPMFMINQIIRHE